MTEKCPRCGSRDLRSTSFVRGRDEEIRYWSSKIDCLQCDHIIKPECSIWDEASGEYKTMRYDEFRKRSLA